MITQTSIQNHNNQVNDHQIQNSNNSKILRRKVIILSIFYLLVAISYTSFSNVIVYLHQKFKHKGYGQAYLTANSSTSLISYIFCPLFLSTTSIKSSKLLTLCASCYLFAMLIPTLFSLTQQFSNPQTTITPPTTFRFISQIIVNGLVGIGSVNFWVLNGMHMANYCQNLPQHKKGKYFSISNTIINMRTIIAPVLTTIGLGFGNQIIYFSLLSLIVLMALPISILLIPNIPIKQSQQHLMSITQQKLEQHSHQHPQQKQQTCTSIFFHFLSFFMYFRKVALLLPCSIVAGLMMGFVSSSLSHLLPSPQHNSSNDSNVSICLLFFGTGSIIGGYLSGYTCDKYSIKNTGYLANIFIILTCLIEVYFLSVASSVSGASITGFFAGLSYSFIFSYVMVVCTVHFKGSASSFATIRFVNVIFYISYQWFAVIQNNAANMNYNMIIQSIIFIPISILASYCIKIQCKRYQQQKKNQKDIEIMEISNKKQIQLQ